MNAEFDVTGITIETERLLLRPFREEDLDDLFAYASEPEVGPMAGWLPHKTVDESRFVLSMFIEEKKTFALVDRATGHVIGSLGVENLRQDDTRETKGREIGYAMAKEYWGQGLMPEAVKAVIDYLFTVCGMDFLQCAHFPRNNQSRRVIEKCGFTYFGDSEHHTHFGTTETCLYYELTKDEWERRK